MTAHCFPAAACFGGCCLLCAAGPTTAAAACAGLYTPASDIDLVVHNTKVFNIHAALKAFANALSQRKMVRNVQVIGSARVPIIKFEMISTGICFDVSFDVASGPAAVAYVKQLLKQWPPLKHLILVLKVRLAA